jgi:tRNA modification GTPase
VIESSGRPLDEVLVIRISEPPREDFEICCHGGTAASRAVVDAFVAEGAVERPWTRLFRTDSLEYDLARSLLAAEGGGQALALARLMGRQLRRTFADIITALEEGMSQKRKTAFLKRLRALSGTLKLGRILSIPPLVIVTGPPNAGKSTLFNALLGESRALTSPFCGTTRDPVEAVFILDGFPVRLADTPGAAHEERDALTAECVAAADRLAGEACLEIRLAHWAPDCPPGRLPFRGADGESLQERVEGRGVIHVLNKSDLLPRKRGLSLPPQFLLLSALRGTGVKRLLSTLRERLGIAKLARRTGPVLINARQAGLVEEAVDVLREGLDRGPLLESLRRYAGSASISRRDGPFPVPF